MSKTTDGKWEMTATKSGSVKTEYYPTRRAAEDAAHEARGWGWATWVKKA